MAMTDTASAQVTETAPASPTLPPVESRGSLRAERRNVAMANLKRSAAESDPPPALGASSPTARVEAKPAAPVETKPAEPEPEKADPATDRGLRAVEQARKKLLDEERTAKTQRELEIAEIAQLRKAAEGKLSSIDELKKLSPAELLDRLDHLTDEQHEALSRAAYARTKAGKADPRAQAAAQEAERQQGTRTGMTALEAKYAALEAKHAALEESVRGEFTRRDHASFREKWIGDAVKAIPADKQTFLSRQYKNEPDVAQKAILAIAGEMSDANDGEPPTQAAVIAEFEKRKRAEFVSLGFNPDELLAPPAPAKSASPRPRTLDVAASNMTRPEDAPRTRAEKSAHAIANLKVRMRTTAEQT